MTTAKLNACGIRWAQELASFDFELEYIKGKNNAAADALSRLEDRLPPDDANRISIQAMKMNLARLEGTQRLGIQQVRDVLDGVTGAAEVTEKYRLMTTWASDEGRTAKLIIENAM